MSFPFTNNRFLPVNIKGDDNITSDLNGNVSLLCNGKTSLYGDTTVSAGKILAIGKSPASATYPLDVSGNIQYSGDLYKAGVIQNRQNETIISELPATTTAVCNKDYVYQGLNNSTLATIQLPNESTVAIGYRFTFVPMKNWVDLKGSGGYTLNCQSGAQITTGTSSAALSLTINTGFLTVVCVALTGTVRWAVVNIDPKSLLGRTNIWTALNSFNGGLSIGGGSFQTPFYFPLESSPSLLTGNTTLAPVTNYSEYTIEPTAPMTITLANITTTGNHRLGLEITFVRGPLNNTSTISFVCTTTTQLVYDINFVNVGGGTVAQALMPAGINRITIRSVRPTNTSLGWVVISQNGVDLYGNQSIAGTKLFTGALTIDTSANLNLNGNLVSPLLSISPTEFKLIEVSGRVTIIDNTTGQSLIRFNNSSGTNLSTAVGLNALAVETQSGGRNNCAFGANSMIANTIGRYNCAFGVNSLRNLVGTSFSQNSAFGYQSLENATTAENCSAVGVRAGFQVTTGSRNTFLGVSADFSSATQHNDSTAIGFGCLIENSNEVRLGRSSETVVCPNRIQVQNSYIVTASPTIITSATTLSGVLFRYYSVSSSAPYSITLPTAAVGYLGCMITFRRVNGTITNAITSASANIFPVNSVTASTSLLDASVCQVSIVCMVLTATPTYGWVVV